MISSFHLVTSLVRWAIIYPTHYPYHLFSISRMDFKENVAPEGFTEPLRLTTKLNMRSTSISNFSSDIEAEKEYLIKLKTQRQKVKRFPYID